MATSSFAEKIQMREPTDIDLLLIGKTGNGKSATGNSILRRRAFKSMPSTSSVTTTIDYEVSEFNDRVIKVVDGPGVGDTRMNNEGAVKLIISAMEYAIAANPRGYHAILLVVRFGGRFTMEDKDTIAVLKKMFGEDFVKNYCILVMTCGDVFERTVDETGQSFKAWCDDQDGVFRDLLNECDNRVILFDNVTKDANKRNDQVARLLNIVDNLRSRGLRYTDVNFSHAKEARERFTVEAKKPMLQEETMKEISLIMQKFQEVQLKEGLESKIKSLEELKIRAEKLCHSVQAHDRGTNALRDLSITVQSLQDSISGQINFCASMMKERENMKKQNEDTRRMLEEKFQEEAENNRRMQEERLTQIQQQYGQLKQENDKNIFEFIIDKVAWAFKQIVKLIT